MPVSSCGHTMAAISRRRRTMPRSRASREKTRWSLVMPSVIAAMILLYLHSLQTKLQQITEESAGFISNQDIMIDRVESQQLQQLIQQQQQQRSLEHSAEQIETDDVNKKAENENNRSQHKGGVHSSPLKFNPPPGYWEHPHQEFNPINSTQLEIQNQLRLRNAQRLNSKKMYHPILPKKVITVVGPESSGSTFLATTLAVASGINLEGHIRGHDHLRVNRRARTDDGDLEIQHLSLPWGMSCGSRSIHEVDVKVVDALVPGECFRYEIAPSLPPPLVEDIEFQAPTTPLEVARDAPLTVNEAGALQRCRDEALISKQSNLSCGGTCGTGKFDGYALYPSRFSVNITSHIDWYLQRGIDVTVILSTRDRSISKRGKERLHCKIQSVAQREDEVALELMSEGLRKYGAFGSIEEDRVIVSSYEALMSMKDEYLFGLYKRLQIISTYVPSFKDGNEKYITDANAKNVDENSVSSKHDISAQQLIPMNDINPTDSLLPNKMIAVVGLEGSGSTFLSTTLGKVLSFDGETRLQHISLPQGCGSQVNATIIDALVPEECFRYEHKLKDLDTLNTKQCRDEARISEENDSNNKDTQWTCGAKCGEGQFSGLALYPDRFFTNVTSHIQWYLTRSVDLKVILVLRDKTISMKDKLRRNPHCRVSPALANVEDDIAMKIMREAYQKYGDERVMIVSYEGLMQYKESYLFEIYKSLGIESTYIPDFIDENRMYVAKDLQHQVHGPSLHKKGRANEMK